MHNGKVINDVVNHNAPITARTAILIPGTPRESDGFVIQMGKAGPQFVATTLQIDGPLLRGYADWGLEQLQPVREFTDAFVRVGSREHKEMEASTANKDRETWKGLLQLRATHTTFPIQLSEKTAEKELSSAATKLIEDPRLRAAFASGRLPQVASWFYPAFFNRELRHARLVLWLRKQGQFVPAIFCPDMKTALFAFAAFGLIAACPNCGKLFALDSQRVDGSKGERYCTARCGQGYRQKAYRLRLKTRKEKRISAKSKR